MRCRGYREIVVVFFECCRFFGFRFIFRSLRSAAWTGTVALTVVPPPG